jgi:hypothetical protein
MNNSRSETFKDNIKGSVKPQKEVSYEVILKYINELEVQKNSLSLADYQKKEKAVEHIISWAFDSKIISNVDRHDLLNKLHETPVHAVSSRSFHTVGTSNETFSSLRKKFLNKKVAIIASISLLVLTLSSSLYIWNTTDVKVDTTADSTHQVEGRTIQFKGALADTNGLPITQKIDVLFNLYKSSADTVPIYTGYCFGENGIEPDFNGSFQVTIGNDCGMKPIQDEVLNQPQLYLGITIGNNPELTPRYPIATVDHVANSETVKGLSVGNSESTIPYIDQEGVLNFAAVSPIIRSTAGDFTIEGNTLLLQTRANTAGSIELAPDEGGIVSVQSALGVGTLNPTALLDVQGDVYIDGMVRLGGEGGIISEEGAPLMIGSERTGNITMNTQGKVAIRTTQSVDDITLGGNTSPSKSNTFNLGSKSSYWGTTYTNNLVLSEDGIGGYWQRKDGILRTVNNIDALVLGFINDKNSVVKISPEVNGTSWINSRLLGIGTSNPSYRLSALDSIANSNTVSLSNLSRSDTSSTSVLRLNLGSKGTNASFIEFYADATSDNSGKKVGSIGMFNGNLTFKTQGADFAEYVEVTDNVKPGYLISITSQGNRAAVTGEPLLGVVTDVAGYIGNYSEDTKDQTVVGMLGQIDTWVTTENGQIQTGDPVTGGSIPGFGAKAISSGEIIGRVLASQEEIQKELATANCPAHLRNMLDSDGNICKCGRVTVYVSVRWHDPERQKISRTNDIYIDVEDDGASQNEEEASMYALAQKKSSDNIKMKNDGKNLIQQSKHNLAPKTGDTTVVVSSNVRAGSAKISADSKELRILHPGITENTFILLTPVTDNPGLTISLKEIHLCRAEDITCTNGFTVITNKPAGGELQFNWMISK